MFCLCWAFFTLLIFWILFWYRKASILVCVNARNCLVWLNVSRWFPSPISNGIFDAVLRPPGPRWWYRQICIIYIYTVFWICVLSASGDYINYIVYTINIYIYIYIYCIYVYTTYTIYIHYILYMYTIYIYYIYTIYIYTINILFKYYIYIYHLPMDIIPPIPRGGGHGGSISSLGLLNPYPLGRGPGRTASYIDICSVQ